MEEHEPNTVQDNSSSYDTSEKKPAMNNNDIEELVGWIVKPTDSETQNQDCVDSVPGDTPAFSAEDIRDTLSNITKNEDYGTHNNEIQDIFKRIVTDNTQLDHDDDSNYEKITKKLIAEIKDYFQTQIPDNVAGQTVNAADQESVSKLLSSSSSIQRGDQDDNEKKYDDVTVGSGDETDGSSMWERGSSLRRSKRRITKLVHDKEQGKGLELRGASTTGLSPIEQFKNFIKKVSENSSSRDNTPFNSLHQALENNENYKFIKTFSREHNTLSTSILSLTELKNRKNESKKANTVIKESLTELTMELMSLEKEFLDVLQKTHEKGKNFTENCGVLLNKLLEEGSIKPEFSSNSSFDKDNPLNWYARLLHEIELSSKGSLSLLDNSLYRKEHKNKKEVDKYKNYSVGDINQIIYHGNILESATICLDVVMKHINDKLLPRVAKSNIKGNTDPKPEQCYDEVGTPHVAVMSYNKQQAKNLANAQQSHTDKVLENKSKSKRQTTV